MACSCPVARMVSSSSSGPVTMAVSPNTRTSSRGRRTLRKRKRLRTPSSLPDRRPCLLRARSRARAPDRPRRSRTNGLCLRRPGLFRVAFRARGWFGACRRYRRRRLWVDWWGFYNGSITVWRLIESCFGSTWRTTPASEKEKLINRNKRVTSLRDYAEGWNFSLEVGHAL